MHRVGVGLILALLSLLSAGCSTRSYTDRTDEMLALYADGRFKSAATEAGRLADSADRKRTGLPRDALVYRLEEGSIARAAGRLDQSVEAFLRADELATGFDQQAQVKLLAEGAASLTNLTALPYRGTRYDRIMLSAYQAMNYLELRQWAEARRWLRRAANHQADAANKYRGQIADEERQLAENLSNRDGNLNSVMSSDSVRSAVDAQRVSDEGPKPLQLEVYGDYQNPFVDYLHGLVFMSTGGGGGEAEQGYKGFRRAQGMVPGNPYLADNVALADAAASGQSIPPTTFIIFESGLAPWRDQFKIDIPLVLLGGDLRNAGVPGIALPQLAWGAPGYPRVLASTVEGEWETARLASFDSIVQTEFDNEYNAILAKSIYLSAVKALAAFAANRTAERMRGDGDDLGGALIQIGTLIGTAVYQYGTNQADQRTWQTLPKEVQVASFPTPPDGVVRLSAAYGPATEVRLEPGLINIVFVKSTVRGAPLHVRQVAIPEGADIGETILE